MKTKYRNVAFLAELLINVLVFSLSCAVLVGLFGKAWEIANSTSEQSRAAAEAQSLVESVKARGAEELEYAQPQADGSLLCHYDASWQPLAGAGPDAAAYTITLALTPENTGAGTLTHISAVAAEADGGRAELFRLETAAYRPTGGAE